MLSPDLLKWRLWFHRMARCRWCMWSAKGHLCFQMCKGLQFGQATVILDVTTFVALHVQQLRKLLGEFQHQVPQNPLHLPGHHTHHHTHLTGATIALTSRACGPKMASKHLSSLFFFFFFFFWHHHFIFFFPQDPLRYCFSSTSIANYQMLLHLQFFTSKFTAILDIE